MLAVNRITPAYAGTTQQDVSHTYHIQDHPRLRGNYSIYAYISPNFGGSPPLTRELRRIITKIIINLRITPAYAGTTFLYNILERFDQDHPRLRGNYWPCRFETCKMSGSPPLTRELRADAFENRRRIRITPAYAGTTNNSC